MPRVDKQVIVNSQSEEELKARIYISGTIEGIELEMVRAIVLLAQLGCINLPRRHGFSYALYERFSGGKIDHQFHQEIIRHIPVLINEDSIEIFIRTPGGSKIRVVMSSPEKFITLPSGQKLKYEFKRGDDNNLVVYFDYSRLVSKVELTQEFLPRFGFRTTASIIKISNTLGFWGTACLFDSKGNAIYKSVANFLNKIVQDCGYKKVFLVGGSQGGTASIVYSQLINSVEFAYAACPVAISPKGMLCHMDGVIGDEDINEVRGVFSAAIDNGKVNLFTTVGDHAHYPFHCFIASQKSLKSFNVCADPVIGHGQCLRHYIKTIYADISENLHD